MKGRLVGGIWVLGMLAWGFCGFAGAKEAPAGSRAVPAPAQPGSILGVDSQGGLNFTTIQAAIDAAQDGDRIKVWPGFYKENIDFKGKRIEVFSTSIGSASVVAATVIDGQQKGPVVKMIGIPDSGGLLAGFTIQNGLSDLGGGIHIGNCSPLIKRCVIQNNRAQGTGIPHSSGDPLRPGHWSKASGGGIYCAKASPTIQDCIIRGNGVHSGQVSQGGGMASLFSSPKMIWCSFERNQARGGDLAFSVDDPFYYSTSATGGGACCLGGSPVFEDCSFSSNTAEGGSTYDATNGEGSGFLFSQGGMSGQGGAIWVQGGATFPFDTTLLVSNCRFTANAGQGGKGFRYGGSEAFANGGTASGGAIHAVGAKLVIRRSIIQRNAVAATMHLRSISEYPEENYLETCRGANVGLNLAEAEISESVIAWGSSPNGSPIQGGGVISDNGSSVSILNCTVAYNDEAGLYGPFTEIKNCILWGNKGKPMDAVGVVPAYSCIQNWTGGGTGNIRSDPKMVSVWGDNYHLHPESPCIDAGAFTYAGALDYEGTPRGFDSVGVSRGDGSDYDIGAHEFPRIGFGETGDQWTTVTTAAPWGRRMGHSTLVYDNKMWVLGGITTTHKNDVWSTADGYWWKMATPGASWMHRREAASLVFNNRMWIMGGAGGRGYLNDVHSSADGSNWTTATADAGWEPRSGAAAVSFKGKMWILGGIQTGALFPPIPPVPPTIIAYKNDIYSSNDGTQWTTVTLAAPWPARAHHSVVVFRNELWLLGGGTRGDFQDVWHSPDGIHWTEAPMPPWPARNQHAALVHDNRIWVMGGVQNRSNLLGAVQQFNDVWWSSDGLSWHLATSGATWTPRFSHSAASFLGKMWVLGGNKQGESIINTGYFSDIFCTGPFVIPPPPPTRVEAPWAAYR